MKNYFIHHAKNMFSGGPTSPRYWIPLEFLNAIAILRKDGIPARLVFLQEAESLAKKEKARFFISTTPLDLWQNPPSHISEHLFQFCRTISEYAELYISGFHGTLLPELILELSGAQAVIRGEPEGAISQLSKGVPIDGIPGITFREDGQIISQPDKSPCDLTEFPVPAYDQVDFEEYHYNLMGWKRFALFETSRGCKYTCDFCAKDVMYGKGFCKKNISQVKQELETAIVKYGVKTGYLFDLDFLNDRDMAMQICDYLIRESFDFQWCCQTRIDEVDEQILELMSKAGCRLIHYGIESHQHLAKGGKYKNHNPDTLKNVIRLTRRLGIKTLCFYIVGFNNHLAREDRGTLQLLHSVDSSYVSLHRYYNILDINLLKGYITEQRRKPQDKIDRAIFFHLLRYYLHPLRIRDLLIQEDKRAIFRDVNFFLKTITKTWLRN